MTTGTEHAEALKGRRLAVLGCGVMGEAMIASLLKGELVSTSQVRGAEPADWRRNELINRYDLDLTDSNAEAVADADLVLLTVKTQ
jgi:pyrroline-5-carboxylate reductase